MTLEETLTKVFKELFSHVPCCSCCSSDWRTRYYHLRDIPIYEWPSETVEYHVADVRNTLDVALWFTAGSITGMGC